MFAGAGLGLVLILAGVVVTALVWAFLRLLPRRESASEAVLPSPAAIVESRSTDGVVMVETGGRVGYINELAQKWFGLQEGEIPDLERLARRVRPADEFLELCAGEGQRRLSVNGRLMEAVSYQVPGLNPAILVSLRTRELGPALGGTEGGQSSSTILNLVSEFNQAISSSLDLETTLNSIFLNVGRLVSADMLEIKLEDPGASQPHIYRYEESAGVSRTIPVERSQFAGYSESLRASRQPVFVPDGRINAEGAKTLIKSYIGIPLLAENELLGSLEVGQTTTSGLTRQDSAMLQLLAGQAALAIRNALRFKAEQGRVAELSGLAKLSQAAGAIRDMEELFTRLVESIAPLFNVEIVGFLIHREAEHVLQGQVPFQGLPSNVVAVYRSVIQPESQAAQLLESRQTILGMDAPTDPAMRKLGLQDIAQLASLREIALVPLVSGERMLGYLQLSNHRGGPVPFTDEELHLAYAVAGQAAAIIENALVVEDAHQRGQSAESLRRIANLVASSAALDEILKFAAQDLVQLLRADLAVVYLLDAKTHEYRVHIPSIFGVSAETARAQSRMDAGERELRLTTVSGTQRPFLSGHLGVDEKLPAVYRPMMDAFQMESVIMAPLLARERSLGELIIGSRTAEFFSSNDVQNLVTAAGMLAAAVEGAALLNQTDETLRRRVEQLTTITHVTRELNTSTDPTHLLELIHEQSLQMTRADCGTILLFEPSSVGTPEPKVTYRLGCPVEEPLTSLTRQVLEKQEALLISDFASELQSPPHAEVRSAMVVPITHQGRILGVINLHARQPEFFDQSASDTLQTLALQAAVALANAHRFQEQTQAAEQLKNRTVALAQLSEISSTANLDRPLEESLRAIAGAIQRATPFQVALLSVYEPDSGLLQRVAGVGMSADTLQELYSRKQPLQGIQQLLRPEFKIGRSYFIPANQAPVIPKDVHSVISMTATEEGKNENTWDPDDFLLVPLEDAQAHPLGLLSVDAPRNKLRPDRATLEALEIFAAQAELAILNQQRTLEMKNKVDSLNAGLQRQQRLLSVTQNDLPMLLRKDLDHTISIHELDRRAQRIRAGLAITEKVSGQLDASSALLALGREMLTQLGMSVALIAEDTPDGPRLLQVLGSVPKSRQPGDPVRSAQPAAHGPADRRSDHHPQPG